MLSTKIKEMNKKSFDDFEMRNQFKLFLDHKFLYTLSHSCNTNIEIANCQFNDGSESKLVFIEKVRRFHNQNETIGRDFILIDDGLFREYISYLTEEMVTFYFNTFYPELKLPDRIMIKQEISNDLFKLIMDKKTTSVVDISAHMIKEIESETNEDSPFFNIMVQSLIENRFVIDMKLLDIVFCNVNQKSRVYHNISDTDKDGYCTKEIYVQIDVRRFGLDAKTLIKNNKAYLEGVLDRALSKHMVEKNEVETFKRGGIYTIIDYEKMTTDIRATDSGVIRFVIHFDKFRSTDHIKTADPMNREILISGITGEYIKSILSDYQIEDNTVVFGTFNETSIIRDMCDYVLKTMLSDIYDTSDVNKGVYEYKTLLELITNSAFTIYQKIKPKFCFDRCVFETIVPYYKNAITGAILSNAWAIHGAEEIMNRTHIITLKPKCNYQSTRLKTGSKKDFDSMDILIPVISEKDKITAWVSDNKVTLNCIIRYLILVHSSGLVDFMRIDALTLTGGYLNVKVSFKAELYKALGE